MSAETAIEWCDSTFNPWIGCTRVSPACDDCYAARSTPARTLGVAWGQGDLRRRTSADLWKQPARWNAKRFMQCGQCGWRGERAAAIIGCGRCGSVDLDDARRRVFCASLADVFDNEVPDEWRVDLFRLIEATPNLDWLLLTKRIGNAAEMMFRARGGHLPLLPNVWLGATVVNQTEVDRDVPKLLATPAAVRFLSIEPMLGSVDVSPFMWPVCGWWKGPHRSYREAKAAGAECGLKRQGLVSAHARFIDWVICGGESGPKARPMHPDWARSLRNQCGAAGVPFLFKQWGEWLGEKQDGAHDHDPLELNATDEPQRVGKKAAGRQLDGRTHDEFPRSAA